MIISPPRRTGVVRIDMVTWPVLFVGQKLMSLALLLASLSEESHYSSPYRIGQGTTIYRSLLQRFQILSVLPDD